MNDLILQEENVNALERFAKKAASSGMVPKDYAGKPDAIFVAAMMGQELGLPPLASLQNIAVINGRPSVWGDAMLAIVQGSGLLDDFNEVWDEKTKTATCHYARKGFTPQSVTFSMDDAAAAGLVKKQGPWQQYPKRMCKLRARGFALRDGFADQLRGIGVAEEERDKAAPERDITPAPASALRKPEPEPVPAIDNDAMQLRNMLNNCVSVAQLKQVAKTIDNQAISEESREMLRVTYAEKAKSIEESK
jgi:hypothetical protein